MRISLIVPALDEAAALPDLLASLPPGLAEVIVADGGSADATRELARSGGARVVTAPAGRGIQMNAGAAVAEGDVLLFLHADTRLPPDAVQQIARALGDSRMVGGGFRLAIDSDDRFLHLVAATANLRTRVSRVFYGDQALFVRRDVFRRLGGFPDVPLMEDVAFGRRLKREGGVALLPVPVLTSARRWERENPLFTTLRNWLLVSLYLLGVSPHRLARCYRAVRD